MKNKQVRLPPEVMERAVRMVFKARGEYESQWATIVSIAGKIGCTAETSRRRVRKHERDTGLREGPTTAEQERVKREVRELRKANEILRLASAFFAQAELLARSIVCTVGSRHSGPTSFGFLILRMYRHGKASSTWPCH